MSEKNKKQKDQKYPVFSKVPPDSPALIRKWGTQNETGDWRGCEMGQLWGTGGDNA